MNIRYILAPENEQKLIRALTYKEGQLSAGLSPSASVGLLMLAEAGYQLPESIRTGMYDYLQDVAKDFGEVGFPTTHSVEAAGFNWLLMGATLAESGDSFKFSPAELREFMNMTFGTTSESGLASWGAGMEAEMPDLDGTAVAIMNFVYLAELGADLEDLPDTSQLSPTVFLNFRRENGEYFCFPFERNPSLSAIAHAALATDRYLQFRGESLNGSLARTLQTRDELSAQILRAAGDGTQLIKDKWHTSPYYLVSRLLAFDHLYETAPQFMVNQMTATLAGFEEKGAQGFGANGINAIETAYALLGMNNFMEKFKNPELLPAGFRDRLEAAAALSAQNLVRMLDVHEFTLEPLWTSKDLYAPLWDFGAILGALHGSKRYLDGKDFSGLVRGKFIQAIEARRRLTPTI